MEFLTIVAIIAIVVVGAIAAIVAIAKVTAFYKQRFSFSIWSGVLLFVLLTLGLTAHETAVKQQIAIANNRLILFIVPSSSYQYYCCIFCSPGCSG